MTKMLALVVLAVSLATGCDYPASVSPEDPVGTTAPATTPPPPATRAPVPGALNPAVTQATIGRTICVARWTATIRPTQTYTNALKRKQLATYADRDPAHYEEDHLVPLALGGAPRDPRNLWPEPWASARRKDVDESALHRQVCAGRMTLAAAQAAILDLWGPGGDR